MVVRKTGPIIEGHTEASQRKFISTALASLVSERPNLYLPAVGQFSLATSALAAGYAPENIWASDNNLYSDIIGSLLREDNPQPVYELCAEDEAIGSAFTGKMERAAYVLYTMKRAELGRAEHFAEQLEDLEANMEWHMGVICKSLSAMIKPFMGIHYQHGTARDVCEHACLPGSVVVVPAPLNKNMDYRGHIAYERDEVAGWAKEFPALYEMTELLETVYLWTGVKASAAAAYSSGIVYAKEYKPSKVDFCLTNNPEAFADRGLESFNRKKYGAYPLPIWGFHDELTEDSKIRFVAVEVGVALYYRDLWAHKLGTTGGDFFALMIVDDKVFGVLGFMLRDLRTWAQPYLPLNAGFNAPSAVYRRANRLLLWCLVTQEFKDFAVYASTKQNHIFEIIALRTTCMSKYRKMKGLNGIMEVVARERMDNGGYKIIYEAEFSKNTIAEVLQKFLLEEKALGSDENE